MQGRKLWRDIGPVLLTLNKSIMLVNTDHVFLEKNVSLFFQEHLMCHLNKRLHTLWHSCSHWMGKNYLKAFWGETLDIWDLNWSPKKIFFT